MRWGDEDPFFGVASWAGRDRNGSNPWTPREFYALGASDWRHFRAVWWQYGVTPRTCIEIGCGAGRLTKAMAGDFDRIVGIDVSDGMLRVAREHIHDPTIEFRFSGGADLPAANGTVDGVFSTHVFQHFDSLDLARDNFIEIARVLRPGGSAMIHLPMYEFPPGFERLERLVAARHHVSGIRAEIRRRKGQMLMRGLSYNRVWLQRVLPPLGFIDVETRTFATSSNQGIHPFVLMRRA